jgi:phytoene desaturase
MRERVRALAPDDVDGYERFLAFSRRVYDTGFEGLVDRPFHTVGSMVRVLPDLLRLACWRSVYAQVSRFVRSEKLRQVLSFHPLLVGGDPLHTPAIYTLISHLERAHGVHFAMGGTGALVDGLVDLIRGQGGAVRCDAEVTRILVDGDRAVGVELADGERIDADLVVANGDPVHVYGTLLPGRRRRWTPAKVRRSRPSMGLFVWYFGTDVQWPEVPHHEILLGPRYQGLLRDIFVHERLAPDFSLYLHRPTATDPSLAPAGGDAFYVLSPVPHLGAGVDWAERAEPYRRAIEAHLSATVLPGLEDHVVSSRMLTPADFETRYLSWQGAGFGLEPRLLQSAWFRPHNRSEEVDGLYLVGAGTHPGAGLPGVVSSAKVLDALVPPPAVPMGATAAAQEGGDARARA